MQKNKLKNFTEKKQSYKPNFSEIFARKKNLHFLKDFADGEDIGNKLHNGHQHQIMDKKHITQHSVENIISDDLQWVRLI